MNKAIILSVQPKWLHKILTGKKTIEIRKSMPKDCDYPIDVYLYCTKAKPFLMVGRNDNKTYLDNGGKESAYSPNHNYIGNKRIVAKFTLNKVVEILPFKKQKRDKVYITYLSHCGDVNWGNKTCLDQVDFENYLGLKTGYGWHIENLEIFDKPMDLKEFYRNHFDEDEAKPCNCGKYCEFQDYDYVENQPCCGIDYNGFACPFLKVQRPFQSWGYAYKE